MSLLQLTVSFNQQLALQESNELKFICCHFTLYVKYNFPHLFCAQVELQISFSNREIIGNLQQQKNKENFEQLYFLLEVLIAKILSFCLFAAYS